MTERVRIHFMDEVRGFCVFCMLFYHAFYLAAYEFGWTFGAVLMNFFMPVEPLFAGVFVMIAGISSQLSRSNLKRGLKLLGVALAVTLVTRIALPEEFICFGILHLLSVCMILFGLLQKTLHRIPASILLTACIGLTVLTAGMWVDGYFGLPGVPALQIPTLSTVDWFFPLGIHSEYFYSSDYFPLFPWAFVFVIGTVFGRWVAVGKYPAWCARRRIPFLSFLGRHALLLYIVHQPIFYGLFWVVSKCIG